MTDFDRKIVDALMPVLRALPEDHPNRKEAIDNLVEQFVSAPHRSDRERIRSLLPELPQRLLKRYLSLTDPHAQHALEPLLRELGIDPSTPE